MKICWALGGPSGQWHPGCPWKNWGYSKCLVGQDSKFCIKPVSFRVVLSETHMHNWTMPKSLTTSKMVWSEKIPFNKYIATSPTVILVYKPSRISGLKDPTVRMVRTSSLELGIEKKTCSSVMVTLHVQQESSRIKHPEIEAQLEIKSDIKLCPVKKWIWKNVWLSSSYPLVHSGSSLPGMLCTMFLTHIFLLGVLSRMQWPINTLFWLAKICLDFDTKSKSGPFFAFVLHAFKTCNVTTPTMIYLNDTYGRIQNSSSLFCRLHSDSSCIMILRRSNWTPFDEDLPCNHAQGLSSPHCHGSPGIIDLCSQCPLSHMKMILWCRQSAIIDCLAATEANNSCNPLHVIKRKTKCRPAFNRHLQ